MPPGEQILLVVNIVEGRRFPKRPRHKLIVETKFDGETLSTDPIDHLESPDFQTELAWELDRKLLHRHRMQRTPIKVQCYALDALTSQKEPIGYVILDLRTAQQKPQRPHWYPLLSSKYQRMKPEIKLMLSIEDESQPKPPTSPAAKQQQEKKEQNVPAATEMDIGTLQAVLNNDEGFYEIGPQGTPINDVFVMSVIIGLASNLAKLVPSSFSLPDPKLGGGFYFYYSLLGNDVTNEAFFDLLNPNFPPERASVRINATLPALKAFLSSHSGLQVHLCCGDQSLGMAVVSLQALLPEDAQSLENPVNLEGLFNLKPMGVAQGVSSEHSPAVGVTVTLRREEQPVNTGTIGVPSPAKQRQYEITPRKPNLPQTHTPQSRRPEEPQDIQPPMAPETPGTPPRPSTSTPDKGLHRRNEPEPLPIKTKKSPHKPHKTKGQPTPTVTSLGPRTLDTHHYCFSVDLRSVHDLDVNAPINCFLRYTYPFFGSAAPVMTSPPVEVSRHMQVLMPKSFCAFDFASTQGLLQETFMSIPLVVEVWHRDKMAGNVMLGSSIVPLGHILAADRARMVTGGVTGYRQIYSERIAIFAAHEPSRRIGELHVVLGLEDLGPVSQQQLIAASRAQQVAQSETSSAEDTSRGSIAVQLAQPQRIPPQPSAPPPITDPRETAEYKAAMELEMWKDQQEELFQALLQQKEASHMKVLAEEWKRRDKEREILVTKKIEEYSQLEEKLKQSMADLEKRERLLSDNEAKVMRLKEELQRDHERKMTELKEAARRMKEDCAHQVEMERSKVRDLEQQKQRLVEQLYAAEKRYQDKENEFMTHKERELSKPEVKLQSELDFLRVEKAELERKLESSNKSKIHYKQQWGRALREVAKIKQQEQTVARARLKKQEQELEHMRLRYLAAEEKEVVKATEKEELEEIKQELSRLRQQELEKQKLSESLGARSVPTVRQGLGSSDVGRSPMTSHNEVDEDIDHRIAKLIEERDTLLQTGVYTTDDRIIAELDRQIRDAIASKG
ncbi:centrosomal protein of 120 kDa isoform X2 [Nematostella vectensis]|uniref:centrosomal protein of 120 kDa isoform X2 n=1 Tax=Nematostella vectensis TaxID=45351 RepID=UPI0013903842|nr:centrosomal protein of 120 kDa isoform X2 [Nematostella vectensis]